MFSLVKAWYESRVAQFRSQSETLGKLDKIISESANIVDSPYADGWTPVGNSVLNTPEHNEYNLHTMITQARNFYRFHPHGRGAIRTIAKYVIGKGVILTPKSKDPSVWHVWREFWNSPVNRMERRQFDIITKAFRDGNCLMQFFNQTMDGQFTWRTATRFQDPLHLKQPTDNKRAINGIELSAFDNEMPVRYYFQQPNDVNIMAVPATDIHHIKLFADMDARTGESYIQPVMQMLTHYKQWMDYRIMFNKIRTAVVLIRYMSSGTGDDINRIKDTLNSSRRTSTNKKQAFQPGTILNASGGMKYEMLAPKLGAADAQHDGRSMILAMAAGTGLPEYAFGDSSNSNYASTLIAESPFVKDVEYWQTFFEAEFKEIYRRVILNAVRGGFLKPPASDDGLVEMKRKLDKRHSELMTKLKEGKIKPRAVMEELNAEESPLEIFYGVDAQWPQIVHRDLKQTAEALVMSREMGWVSDPTAASIMGNDIIEEVRKQKQYEENGDIDDNPLLRNSPQNDEDDPNDNPDDIEREMESVLNQLTEEDVKSITRKGTKLEDIVRMVRGKLRR